MNNVLLYAVDMAVIIALMAGVRQLAGMIGGVSGKDRLSVKTNPAFGIFLGGALAAIAIMLTGASSGEFAHNLADEFIIMGAYGILGIVLMALTRIIFDRYLLSGFSIRDGIIQGNKAAALVDAGNMIATAIVIRAVMLWVHTDTYWGLLVVAVGWLFSQAVMTLATVVSTVVYNRRQGDCLQGQLQKGNLALATLFSGYRIGAALAITAASAFVAFSDEAAYLPFIDVMAHGYAAMLVAVSVWTLISLVMFAAMTLIALLIRRAVLNGVAVYAEVGGQQNLGVAAIQAAIYCGVGLLFATLFV